MIQCKCISFCIHEHIHMKLSVEKQEKMKPRCCFFSTLLSTYGLYHISAQATENCLLGLSSFKDLGVLKVTSFSEPERARKLLSYLAPPMVT